MLDVKKKILHKNNYIIIINCLLEILKIRLISGNCTTNSIIFQRNYSSLYLIKSENLHQIPSQV